MDEKFLQILKNALQVYIKFGIKSVAMDDLCRELKISKKTLYKYVANKEELLERIFVDYIAFDFNTFLNEKKITQFTQKKNAIDYFFIALEYLQQQNVVTPLLLNDLQLHYPQVLEKLCAVQRSQRYEILEKNLQQGQCEGLYRTDINTQLVLFLFTHTSIDKDSKDINPFEKKDLFDELLRIYMSAIATPKGLEYYNSQYK
ncbi:MAG: TetR/AcrR family transcriptional regulator [Bacteroidales bacterium]|jgi:AcrR family transcriptional regulator|nr:TetR/AcrR family transcriptional regulator [Bacteroidales bacterium]